MASITIRTIEEGLKARLRVRAARHGRSMEAEAREILRVGLATGPEQRENLAQAIRRHIDPIGGIRLKLPKREPVRNLASFE